MTVVLCLEHYQRTILNCFHAATGWCHLINVIDVARQSILLSRSNHATKPT